DPLVEKVAHRVHEDHSRAAPLQRLAQALRPQAEVEPLLVMMAANAAPPLGEGLRVTVGAPRAHLIATGDRVPRRLCPLDRRRLRHAPVLPQARRIGLSPETLGALDGVDQGLLRRLHETQRLVVPDTDGVAALNATVLDELADRLSVIGPV